MGGEEMDRGKWGSQLEFVLSCVGYAVGLGNIWRFPYLAYINGGASFLIPYVIMLFIAGLPLFFMELSLGQFSSQGPITVWKLSPFFAGCGMGSCIISAVVAIYYNIIIMYAVYYMMASFVYMDTDVPWGTCNNTFNSDMCRKESFTRLDNLNETAKMDALYSDYVKKSCVEDHLDQIGSMYNTNLTMDMINSEYLTNATWKFKTWCKLNWTTPAAEYFSNSLLDYDPTKGIDMLGPVSLKLTLCNLLTWILIFFCLMKGVKSSGKVVYFTATFPYVIIIVLLVRGLTLPGYYLGIEYYIIPKWERLLDAKVWGDAATQIFYSLGVSFGGLLTMSSYNRFNNNCHRDALLVAFINCGTSVFAGFAIFSLLGFMALETNQNVEDVASQGPGLLFEVYPEGLSRLPVAALWSFLFFFMVLLLGLDSQFAMIETVISGISDIWPSIFRKYKALFTLCTCAIGFILGIPQCTKGGILVMTLMNWYSGSYNLMIIAFVELIAVMYVYGFRRFMQDIEMMLGKKPKFFWIYWLTMWLVITPLATIFIVIIGAIQNTPAGYGSQTFPDWAQGIGWVMVCVPLACIPIVMIVEVIRKRGIKAAVTSEPSWGPADPVNRTGRYAMGPGAYATSNPGLDMSDEKGHHPDLENGRFAPPEYQAANTKL